MPNITYIKFTRNFFNVTNGQLPFSAITATTNVSDAYPDNLILLIEDHDTDTETGEGVMPLKSTTSVTFMILAWAFMLIGFTLCWCFQLFEKKKTQQGSGSGCACCMGSGGDRENETQVGRDQEDGERCFVLDGWESRTDRTNDALDPTDVIRRYDLDVESLPSYTIVSGLPTYDDALEEFRKAGIILKPPMPIVKIFDNETKESSSDLPEYSSIDNASVGSTCTCGAGAAAAAAATAIQSAQIIELNPEHLQMLSQKRLSLQISFNSGLPAAIRRNSRPRVDLCQQVSRNNLWRAQRDREMPGIHRSSSMTFDNERSLIEQRLRKLEQHRGSIS